MIAPQLGLTFGSAAANPSAILADRSAGIFYIHGRLNPVSALASAGGRGRRDLARRCRTIDR